MILARITRIVLFPLSAVLLSLCLLSAQEASLLRVGDLIEEPLVPESTELSSIENFGSQNVLEFEVKAAIERLAVLKNSSPALGGELVVARTDLQALIEEYLGSGFAQIDGEMLISAYQALGDSWVLVEGMGDFPSAWSYYVNGLNWLAGQPRSAWAANAYVEMFTRTFEDPFYLQRVSDRDQVTVMSQPWIGHLRDLLQLTDESQTGLYLLALFDQYNPETTLTERLRIRETYERALEGAEEQAWYHSARFHYALWLQEIGNASLDESGAFIANPDLPTAVSVFRDLIDSGQVSDTRRDEILNRLQDLESPDVTLEIGQAYLPGADVDVDLIWKNATGGSVRIFEISPATGFNFAGLGVDASIAEAASVDPTLEILEIPVSRDNLDNPYVYETKTIQLPLALDLGAYLVELEIEDGETAREILWVTDIAQINSISETHQTLTIVNTEEARLFEDSLDVVRWVWDESTLSWREETTVFPVNESRLRLEHEPTDSVFWVLAYRDRRISFSKATLGAVESMPEDSLYWAISDKTFLDLGETARIAYHIQVSDERVENLSLGYRLLDSDGKLLTIGQIEQEFPASGFVDYTVGENTSHGALNWEVFEIDSDKSVFSMPIAQVAPQALETLSLELQVNNQNIRENNQWSFPKGGTVDISGEFSDLFTDSAKQVLYRLNAYRSPLDDAQSGNSGMHSTAPSTLMRGLHTQSSRWESAYNQENTTDEFGRFRDLIPVVEAFDSEHKRYQYWVDFLYYEEGSGAWVSAGWMAFVVSEHAYIGRLGVSSTIVEPGGSVLMRFSAESPFRSPVAVDGQIRVERKEWEETWIDSRGRQLSGTEYRETRSRRGFFRSWAEGDRAYRLLDSGFRQEPIFARRLNLRAGNSFQRQFRLDEPGIYEFSWMDIDAAGRPIVETQTVYCIDLDSGSTATWNLQDIIWVSPDAFRPNGSGDSGVILFPDEVKRAWVEIQSRNGREMKVYEVGRGLIQIAEADFSNLWAEATEIKIGFLEGTEFQTMAMPFGSMSAGQGLEINLSRSQLGPLDSFEISAFNLKEKESHNLWYILSPELDTSLQDNLSWTQNAQGREQQASSWTTSFDAIPYYFPKSPLSGQEQEARESSSLLAADLEEHALYPLAIGEWLHQIELLNDRDGVVSMTARAPDQSAEYRVQFLEFDPGGDADVGVSNISVRAPVDVDIRAPEWARKGDRIIAVTKISNNDESPQTEVFETRLSFGSESEFSSLNRMDLEPEIDYSLRSYFDIPNISDSDDNLASISFRREGKPWKVAVDLELHPNESLAKYFSSVDQLQAGLWKNESVDFARLDAVYFAFGYEHLIEMLGEVSEQSAPEFVLAHLRNLLFELLSGDADLAKIRQEIDHLERFLTSDGGISFYENSQKDIFWSAFIYLLLSEVRTEFGVDSPLDDAVSGYLSSIISDGTQKASARIWSLYALSTRFVGTDATASKSELSAYQRMWRIRATLPPYSLRMLSVVADRFGLVEDRKLWEDLATRREETPTEIKVNDRLRIGLASATTPFFSNSEQTMINELFKSGSETAGGAFQFSISGDALDRTFLLKMLLALNSVQGVSSKETVGFPDLDAFRNALQVRVSDRILSPEEFELARSESGYFMLILDPSVGLANPQGSLTLSIQGSVQPLWVLKGIDDLRKAGDGVFLSRDLKRISRVQTLLRGVVEKSESVKSEQVVLNPEDRLLVGVKINTDRALRSLVLREPLPAGMRLVSSDLKLVGRSGRELPVEDVEWYVDPYGIEARIRNLPEGEWSMAYRLGPDFEGEYHSGNFSLFGNEPEFQKAYLPKYSVKISEELE
ncbi:MAG: hypothetical protein ACPGN3_02175 [Opitutales bacterium]